jgi:hypothetical protein
MALLHSGPFRLLFSTVSPLRPRSLRRAETTRRVVRLRAAVNFFRDSPQLWVCFFACRRCPTAICRSPNRSSSAPIFSTAASLLEMSCSSTTASVSSGFASRSVAPTSSTPVLISESILFLASLHLGLRLS